ncbi:hypothetical protein [Rhodococcus sp. ACT016]|uniref:hypothetical protein n=1 Tax=Rhodococcus sp. ACT016 TaxID=3134808 RepID=UPI003D2E9403
MIGSAADHHVPAAHLLRRKGARGPVQAVDGACEVAGPGSHAPDAIRATMPVMSVITDYFTAPSDEVAATALDGLIDVDPDVVTADDELNRASAEEASRPRIRAAASGTPVLHAKRIDPTVSLGRLEAVLTGRTYEEITAGPRRGSLVSAGEDGDCLVLTVADELRDALADLDSDAIAAAARAWVFDEAAEPSEASAPFLTALAELAAGAVARGDRIYCHIVI